MTALEMLGLMAVAHDDMAPPAPGVSFIRVREIGAAVRAPGPSTADTTDAALEYDQLLETLFARGAILPAPPGLVFRTVDALKAWLEQNYVGLSEGLAFLSGRCEARVHVRPANSTLNETQLASLKDEADDAVRVFRQRAAATVVLPQPTAPVLLSVGFLLKATDWDAFTEVVLEQDRRYTELRFEQSGPWIPYDFVKLDIGV